MAQNITGALGPIKLAPLESKSIGTVIDEDTNEGIDRGIEKGLDEDIGEGIEKGISKGIKKGIEKGTRKNFLWYLPTPANLQSRQEHIIQT